MARTIRKENPELVRTMIELRKAAKAHHAPIWAAVADRLARSRHQVDPMNVGQLDRVAAPEDTVIVAGKLLADGRLTKPLTVAAFHYSAEARSKIHAAGGKTLTVHELLRARPEGTGVRLLG
ncbi:MAG: 50S ribosomal protein L18e [Thermoplasmata archaeon]